jgi:peptidylprolyl isomerase
MREFSRRSALAAAFAATTTITITGVLALSESAAAQQPVTTPSGLKYIDVKVGTGPSPKTGQTCVMHYTGWLYEGGKKGAKFDSSLDRGQPFEFKIGMHQVIAGWDEGVATMKVGGKRTLIIPPDLGYGARRRRRHSAERDADVRRRTAGDQITRGDAGAVIIRECG